MLTIGLVRELAFLSHGLGFPLKFSIEVISKKMDLLIDKDILSIAYKGEEIWRENVQPDVSFFGVESCDLIFKIVNRIDAGDYSWKEEFNYIID